MSKHTPGPWRVGKKRRGSNITCVLWDKPGKPPPGCTNEYVVAHTFDGALPGLKEAAKANAQLIAAAPDLLAALEEVSESLELSLQRLGVGGQGDGPGRNADADSFWGTAALEAARKAINKATGRSAHDEASDGAARAASTGATPADSGSETTGGEA